MLRPTALGRERLEARARRLPRPEQLLQPQVQRLDDLAERLRRGLADNAARARSALQADAARLSAPLLAARFERARDRLGAARLVPQLVTQRLASSRERLTALARLAAQFHPDRPLERGYVRVMDEAGHTLTTRAAAAKEPQLTLKFRDGLLGVGQGNTRPARTRRPGIGEQGDLF